MKRTIVWMLVIASVLCFSAMAAYGEGHCCPPSRFAGKGLLSMAEKLDLSEQQIEKIKALRLGTQKRSPHRNSIVRSI